MVEDKGGLGTLGRQARFHHEKEWWRTRVRDLFDLYGGVDRFDPFFEELFDRFGASSTWRVLPGVTATLVRLHREGMRLGIISNWDHRLLGIADGLGLSGLVDVVVPSGLFGTAKPHPSIFKKALLMLGVRAEESLHVGDSLEEDYHGAQRVGMHALWLAPPQQKARGVSRIGSLYEIHRWLRCS
jgi:putative hydrolase of the HAD superfamily